MKHFILGVLLSVSVFGVSQALAEKDDYTYFCSRFGVTAERICVAESFSTNWWQGLKTKEKTVARIEEWFRLKTIDYCRKDNRQVVLWNKVGMKSYEEKIEKGRLAVVTTGAPVCTEGVRADFRCGKQRKIYASVQYVGGKGQGMKIYLDDGRIAVFKGEKDTSSGKSIYYYDTAKIEQSVCDSQLASDKERKSIHGSFRKLLGNLQKKLTNDCRKVEPKNNNCRDNYRFKLSVGNSRG